jgi:hypothetical protein
MIVFDLRCGGGHVFEAWFASTGAFEEQVAADRLRCPVCDDASVVKAPMAPAIAAKGSAHAVEAPVPAEAVKTAMRQLAAAQAEALRSSRWVGTAFADQARAMHEGERSPAPIHGQATPAQAKALVEDGVPIAPLPFPVVPPKTLN